MKRNYFKITGLYQSHSEIKQDFVEWLAITLSTNDGDMTVHVPGLDTGYEQLPKIEDINSWSKGQAVTVSGHIFLLSEEHIQLVVTDITDAENDKESHIAEYGVYAKLIHKKLNLNEDEPWIEVQTLFCQHEWNAPPHKLVNDEEGNMIVFGSKLKPECFESGINIMDDVLMKGHLVRRASDNKLCLDEHSGQRA
ncbi:hypothetical protein [uncultured Psychrobacter sp.]|uniref:hypothetical protein n=2 Tax=Psychrobacter TaxID=497 RepID=UPI0030D6D7FF